MVLSPHFRGALLARDRGDEAPDLERSFDYALTFDREIVVRAAHGLLTRLSRALVHQGSGRCCRA